MTRETKMAASGGKTRAAMHELLTAFESFKQANDARLKEIETKRSADPLLEEKINRIDTALHRAQGRLDRLALEAGRPSLSGEAPSEAKAAFAHFLRSGDGARLVEAKALSGGSPADGGHVAPPEIEAMITAKVREASPIRAIASVRQSASGVFKKPVSLGGASAGWVAETAARPETDTSTLALIEFPAAELYAMPAATPTLLDDAMVNLDEWLADEVRDVFAAAEGAAFVNGDGVNKPRGFLSYPREEEGQNAWGEIGFVATGAAGAFPAEDPVDVLIDLIYAPAAAYRANARFVMNKASVSVVRKFKDSEGNYIWQPGLAAGQPATLMGYRVTEAEDMPDIAAGECAIAFGDFERGYLIVDRQGVQILRDPYSAKPYVLFYTTRRVGGGVQDFNAIKLLKFAAE
ncbi:phage major capsid protein [Alkalicaulis satelles]|uniref:Phage major capsid protein n=1 Tax=Alkalicaulis satelles TaxID=2609175 RepID=A0A5M6ZSH8_9PROT|nr:phage major capsid protein [Alkalicaulis satelles]KAA5805271.1 phage major capsid protein [Alkalicaulis satelles]